MREHLLIFLADVAMQVGPHPLTGFGPWHAPSPEIINEPWIANRKPPKLAGRHPVLRQVGLDLVQKLHGRRLT